MALADTETPNTPAADALPEAGTTKQEKTETKTASEAEAKEDAQKDELVAGLDYYYGRSNLDGQRRFSDGFWIGNGLVYPASVYLQGSTAQGIEGKLAYGTGNLYQNSDSALKQPFEAWGKAPLGRAQVTLGKFYVPFGLQEWQFETKWGGMVEQSFGDIDVAASVNYDQVAHHSNLYLRAGRTFEKDVNIGISAGFGRGLSYGSTHNRAFGIDLSARRYGFRLQSEYTTLRDAAAGNFHFAYGRLIYERLGKLQPFVGRYYWNDQSGYFGQFGSSVLGATYAPTPELSFEVGTASTSVKRVNWVQVHWTAEWKVLEKKAEPAKTSPG